LLALKRAFVSQLAGWLSVELLALKRGVCVAVSWLAVELLALKRGVCVTVSWLSCCPAEQRAVHKPSGRQRLASDDDAGEL
jgi:hypothetical protein